MERNDRKNGKGKRIEAKELRCQDRQPLQEVIPLPAPYVVYIDPTNLCNFRCLFCPTGDPDLLRSVGRPRVSMSLNLFRKIVKDLKDFGTPLKLISLYKDGEPLLNRDFPEMVSIIKKAGVAERVWTKTNGSRLNPKLNQALVNAGLDMICISVEAVSEDGYREIAGVKIDYEAFRENVLDLYRRRSSCDLYVKIADTSLTPEQIDKFYDDFQDRSDFIGVEQLMGWSYSSVKDFTLGTKPDTYDGLPFTEKDVCPYPFYVLAVNSDGSVSLCGNDWSQSTAVGNVKKESLLEIWHGKRLFEFRRMLLEGRRGENRACGDCYYLKVIPDNIDPWRYDILKKIIAAHTPAASPKKHVTQGSANERGFRVSGEDQL